MHLGNKIVFSLMIVREWELIGKLSETTIPLASPLVFFFLGGAWNQEKRPGGEAIQIQFPYVQSASMMTSEQLWHSLIIVPLVLKTHKHTLVLLQC